MNIVTFFITNTQSPLIEQPIKCCFDHITKFAETATIFGVTFGNQWFGLTLSQRLANLVLGIISPVCKHLIRTSARATAWLLDRWDSIDQCNGHLRIMNICTGMFNRQRGALAVNNQVTLRAVFAPIRGIWACFRPPKSARTEQLSMAETDQSIASAMPNSFSRACHIFCQTPAICQSRRRRQQVMPLPQPISRGRYSHGVPVLRINKMPVRQARSLTLGRPPFGFGGSGGICRSIRFHSSSVSSGLAIIMSSITSCYRCLQMLYRLNYYSIIRFC